MINLAKFRLESVDFSEHEKQHEYIEDIRDVILVFKVEDEAFRALNQFTSLCNKHNFSINFEAPRSLRISYPDPNNAEKSLTAVKQFFDQESNTLIRTLIQTKKSRAQEMREALDLVDLFTCTVS